MRSNYRAAGGPPVRGRFPSENEPFMRSAEAPFLIRSDEGTEAAAAAQQQRLGDWSQNNCFTQSSPPPH